jgi:hypothetical protein
MDQSSSVQLVSKYVRILLFPWVSMRIGEKFTPRPIFMLLMEFRVRFCVVCGNSRVYGTQTICENTGMYCVTGPHFH